jgi:hypothetical protein
MRPPVPSADRPSDDQKQDNERGQPEQGGGDESVPSAMEQESEHCAIVVGERAVFLVEYRFSNYLNRKLCEFLWLRRCAMSASS